MPRLEEIEQFKAELNSLGHEPSILAERGERLEDVPIPEQGLDDDLDALLNVSEEDAAATMEEDAGVDSIEEAPAEEEDEDLFGLDTGEDQMPPLSEESEDDFSIPEDLLAGFSMDEDDEPDEAAPAEPEEDEFSLPEEFFQEETPADETGGEESPAEPEEPGEDEFSLPEEFFQEEAPADETAGIEEIEEAEEEFPADELFDESFLEEPLSQDEFSEEPSPGDEFSAEEAGESETPEEIEEEPFEIPEEFAAAADILSQEEEAEEPGEETSGEFGEIEEFETPEEESGFGGEEDFSLPEEFSMDQLEDDFAGEMELGEEEAGPSAPDEPETPSVPEEEFELPETDELSFEPEEPEEPEEAAEVSEGEPAEDEELSFFDEDAEAADFSMPEGFPFEEPSEGAAGGAEAGGADEFDIPSAGDIEDIDEANFEVDEFSLGDLGEQFGEIEESFEPASEEELNPALAVSEELPEGDEILDLEDEEFERLQDTLNRQPLNLRIAIEELIGEHNLAGPHLQKLVRALVDGKSPRELAAIVGSITGKKIRIPARYEKGSGAVFEAERGTFAYAFRQNILPILRVVAAAAVVLGIVTYLTFTFVYRPIHALILYNAGYKQLEQDAYREANLFFDNAVDEWKYKSQYFRFAEGFQDKRQYSLAGEKYEQLLRPVIGTRNGELQKRPGVGKIRGKERQAILDYAAMDTQKLENFEHAESLLNVLLSQEKHDYDALLEAGDNYLAWGAYDPGRYEDARKAYATLIQHYGSRYELLFRMLRYFIRTDNYPEVTRLKKQFQADKSLKVEPDAYAELGGYLIDKNDLDDVHDILARTLKVDPTLPEAHYHLARYFRRVDEPEEERKALDFAQHYFEAARPLGKTRLKLLVDTYDRQGEADYDDKEYLTAEEYFLKARDRYEDALNRKILEPERMFGRIYRNLGNLYYYVAAQFDQAYEMFETAEQTGYTSPEIHYKKGYIRYNEGKYQDALAQFYLAADGYSVNENLLLATGNALFNRSDYYAAQGYYSNLLDELEQRRRNISVLLPQERPEDRSLIERLIRTHNNLGVTLQRLSLASGDRQKFSRALVHFTDSMENFDLLSRNPDTMERGSAVNLGYLNQRAMLYPVDNYELQIYNDIPLDMETLKLQ